MEDLRWREVAARNTMADGQFVYAVVTTGVYCRPSCPSRRPRPENVRFYETPEEAETAGFRACLRCQPKRRVGATAGMVIKVCRFLEKHQEASPSLETLARVAGLSKFHLLRVFREATGMTPRAYLALCRVRDLKRNLRQGQNVTRAMQEAGYGSSSRVYEASGRELGMTPREYRNGGLGRSIRFVIVRSTLGQMLVGATDRGICAVQFGDDAAELERSLRREFPFAEMARAESPLLDWVAALEEHLRGQTRALDLPVDIQATVFQRRVWQALQTIPYGETRTYAELAAMAGKPSAVRAAASACAANPVAVVVPCHRALRTDGSLGGYAWGLSRKVQLLALERGQTVQPE